jgi:hypothetical protein
MVCGNLFPCRVQIPQWPCNDEMATRNRHVHVLGQVHRVRCNDASASRNLLAKALAQVRPQQLAANAGYDAEWVHRVLSRAMAGKQLDTVAASGRKGQVQSPPGASASANQASRWQRLVGMAKCNHTVGGRGQ